MARIQSIAIGGYYPTPKELIPSIAARIGITAGERYAFLDPCAGEGAALLGLADALYTRTYGTGLDNHRKLVDFYSIELEETRAKVLLREFSSYQWKQALHTDAFQVAFERGANRGVSCLYLNPPYDHDREFGRLEERFLARFTDALRPDGGVLVFVVPYYALAASARTLATRYASAACFKFPAPHWDAYKQVVLYARRRDVPLMEPDGALLAKIERWAKDPASIAELTPESRVLGELPMQGHTFQKNYLGVAEKHYNAVGLETFEVRPLDILSVKETFTPWCITDRSGRLKHLGAVMPEPDSDSLFQRKYPTAMPPRPAHIAAALAAGVFNGERVSADDPTSGAPDLLVKGVFDREFRTVEEKVNKDGDKIGEIQVQQPKLVVTVLDLSTKLLYILRPEVGQTGTVDPAEMTTGDLIGLYGKNLLRVLRDHCPVLHDPADPSGQILLPTLDRPLFGAQAQATMAAVKLLGGPDRPLRARRGKSVPILGEIGSGKTSVAVATALAIGAKRSLVLCPPHLLLSWQEQIAAVYKQAKSVVLTTVADVQAFAADDYEGPIFAILSREAAKLGHAWVAGDRAARCPTCNARVPDEDLARKRTRCSHRTLIPANDAARILQALVARAAHALPLNAVVSSVSGTCGRMVEEIRQRAKAHYRGTDADAKAYQTTACAALRSDPWLPELAQRIFEDIATPGRSIPWSIDDLALGKALTSLLWFIGDDALAARMAVAMYQGAGMFPHHNADGFRYLALRLVGAMTWGSPLQRETLAALHAIPVARDRYVGGFSTETIRRDEVFYQGGSKNTSGFSRNEEGEALVWGAARGSEEALRDALSSLYDEAGWHREEPCGEFLFQADPDGVRRYPLATYLSRFYGDSIDCTIIDEGHEYATDGSAQERAAHRLTNLGHPVLFLTGSVMNGYAESLFTNWWALGFPAFRREFGHDDRSRFVDRYGYRKRLVLDEAKADRKIIGRGAQSDRVEATERDLGNAPGVLPVFILKYLLPYVVTIHKADLKLDLPPCREIPCVVEPLPEQSASHAAMMEKLLHRVKADRFDPERAGKLWGQVIEAPSHLDRCTEDTGNVKTGEYEVRYPKSVGGSLIYTAEPLLSGTILPKERWLLDVIRTERAEGRNVLVFSWHVELLPRIARLIAEEFGFKVPVLYPEKVPASKRQQWITDHVVSKDAPVLVTNPMCVQTGLNNLVHFSTQAWMENPACNPIIYRQALGRSDRIGKRGETRAYFPLYGRSPQEKAHQLLLHKVGVSMATDGLDADSALQAAGVGESGVTGFAVGKELYKMLTNEAV